MKGDFTRSTFQPEKHYTSVRMQQGRLQLDSDWNEQVDIQNHLRHIQTLDLIGADNGVPTIEGDSENPYRDSFKISTVGKGSDLAIARGRLYVNGILCELEATPFEATIISYNQIKVNTLIVDGRQLAADQWIGIETNNTEHTFKQIIQIQEVNLQTLVLTLKEDLKDVPEENKQKLRVRHVMTYKTQPDYPIKTEEKKELGIYLAYIDVWQRHITTIEDTKLREVALINTPDTATRSQTLWQLKIHPIVNLEIFSQLIKGIPITLEKRESLLSDFKTLLTTQQNFDEESVKFSARFQQLIEKYKPNVDENKLEDINNNWSYLSKSITKYKTDPTSLVKEEWKNFIGKHKNRPAYMNACAQLCISAGATSDNRGYQRLENQLYRVEIHNPGEVAENNKEKTATFKWSRENGSIVSAIEKCQGSSISIRRSNNDAWVNSQPGQWLEITNEEMELKGKPGVMVRLQKVSDTQIEFDPSTIVNGSIPLNPTKVRRWDYITPEAVITAKADWIPLEAGIMVKFNPESSYETGDYWLIPARSATNDIEWPNYQNDKTIAKPLEQLRQGIYHDYCLLALVKIEEEDKFELVKDLRIIFPPLMRCMNTVGGAITGDIYINGKVGIGNDTPNATLDVSGDMKISETTTTKNLRVGQNAPDAPLGIDGDVILTGKVTAQSLKVQENATVSQIKIGQNAPDAPLGVDGNAKISETITTKNLQIEENINVTKTITTKNIKIEENANVTETITTKNLNIKETVTTRNLRVEENANITGKLTAKNLNGIFGFNISSSRTLKENIQDLSSQEVADILSSLNPVKFIYKEDESKTLHAGFIAEDTPDLLTIDDKQAIKIADVVAILTKVVQDDRKMLGELVDIVKKQQAEITALKETVKDLEARR